MPDLSLLGEHALALVLVATLLLLLAGVGRWTLRRVGPAFDDPIDELGYSVAAGSGVVAALLLAVGAIGALRPVGLISLLGCLAIVVRRDLRAIPGLLEAAHRRLVGPAEDRSLSVIAMVVFGAVGAFLIVLSLAPPVDWDTLAYHLQIPADFLGRGRVFVPEDNLHVSNVGLIHMLYVPLLAAGSRTAPALLSAAFAWLLGLLVYGASLRFFGRRTAAASLVLLWGSTILLFVAVTPRIDVTLAFFLCLAHVALLRGAESEDDRWLALSGAMLGLSVGIKVHALAYGIALLPWALSACLGKGRGGGRVVRGSAFGLCALIGAAPWLIKNAVLLGAPFYPFLADRTLEGWLVPFHGTESIPPTVDPRVYDFIWDLRRAFNLRDAFLAPQRLTIEPEAVFYFANPVFLLLPLALLWRGRRLGAFLLPPLLYLLIVLVPHPSGNLRYLLPAVPALTIGVVAGVVLTLDRFLLNRPGRLVLAGLIMPIALAPTALSASLWVAETQAGKHVAGLVSTAEYVKGHPLFLNAPGIVERVNQEISPTSRILMIFEARGLYFDRDVIQDMNGTNWALLSVSDATDRCLAGSGITHVLLYRGALEYFDEGGLDLQLVRWPSFVRFRERCLDPIHWNEAYILYRLHPEPIVLRRDSDYDAEV